MEGAIVFGCLLGLGLNALISGFMKNVADAKGCNGMKAFWICFFFSMVGWIYVAALPDLYARYNQQKIIDLLEQNLNKNNAEIKSELPEL